MKKLSVTCLMSLTACVGSASFSGFGTSSSTSSTSGGDPNATVTIPNVFKMPKDQAIAALHKAGVRGTIDFGSSLCGSVVEGQIVEMNEVCYQHPPAGRTQGARLPIEITIQTEDPRHGSIGRITEWRLMPKVVGMTFEQAVAEMKRAGFDDTDRIQRTPADETSCKPNVVCKQYPDYRERAGLHDGKVFYVGEGDRQKPVLASTEPPPRTPTTTTTTTTTTTSTPTTAPRKRWGGDGSPPSRDEGNRPRGPGGPQFMGRGELCTNKIDHCLRPGVWFAADNVIAGKMFRGTPVFEFEGKWWTWRGDEATYQFLYRTKVADSSREVVVGKPIIWLFDEPDHKFLDNEHDMLTTSRWTVGVVESVAGDTIKVKGWSGPVSLDTVRVIVEEKQAKPAAPADIF